VQNWWPAGGQNAMPPQGQAPLNAAPTVMPPAAMPNDSGALPNTMPSPSAQAGVVHSQDAGVDRAQDADVPDSAFADVWPPHFERMENETTDQKTDSDYFADILENTKNKVFRFKSMPVPVFIYPCPNPLYTQVCISGFESWENRSDGLVRFVQVNDPDRARIKVTWNHLGLKPDGNEGALGGHTVMKWNTGSANKLKVLPIAIPGTKVTVPPQVIEINLDVIDSKQPENRPLLLKNIVTHELGHALGLIGHSPHRCDMMNGITDEYSRISQRDLNTLKRLYEAKPDVAL
jgi:hypothetical protein